MAKEKLVLERVLVFYGRLGFEPVEGDDKPTWMKRPGGDLIHLCSCIAAFLEDEEEEDEPPLHAWVVGE